MKKHNLHHLWYIFGAYGVWFAIFSGMEEISNGKYWKAGLSLIFGIIIYVIIERREDKK